MRGRRLVLVVPLLFAVFGGLAWSQNGEYERYCARPKGEDRFRRCMTDISDSGIGAYCGGRLEPAPNEPLVADLPGLMWKCKIERQNGARVVVCMGGYYFPLNLKEVLSEAEFKDAQTRCSRLCEECPTGWK